MKEMLGMMKPCRGGGKVLKRIRLNGTFTLTAPWMLHAVFDFVNEQM